MIVMSYIVVEVQSQLTGIEIVQFPSNMTLNDGIKLQVPSSAIGT